MLSLKVHAAAMKEQVIRSDANRKVAIAALNEALGLPLDSVLDLTTPLAVALAPAGDAEKQALQARPELGRIQLASQAADAQAAAARAGYYPKIAMRGVFEADRQQFVRKGGANWMFGAGLEWNLFDGHKTRANDRRSPGRIGRGAGWTAAVSVRRPARSEAGPGPISRRPPNASK